MAKIKHVAITCEDPDAVARFYKEGFDLVEVARNDRQVQLSDGDINLTILKWKTDKDADVGPNGENYSGIHHIGFQVDSLQDTGARLQDIEGANRLLDDNGVLDTDGDGVREYNGVPLRITYQTSVNAIRQDMQALVRGWWRQIGIERSWYSTMPASFSAATPWMTRKHRIAGSSPTCRCTLPVPA